MRHRSSFFRKHAAPLEFAALRYTLLSSGRHPELSTWSWLSLTDLVSNEFEMLFVFERPSTNPEKYVYLGGFQISLKFSKAFQSPLKWSLLLMTHLGAQAKKELHRRTCQSEVCSCFSRCYVFPTCSYFPDFQLHRFSGGSYNLLENTFYFSGL